jgi:hypothetical protein
VTYTFTGGTPPAVATQIGSGAYTQATLSSGSLTLSIPSGETNFSVAYTCPSFAGSPETENFEFIAQASTKDGTSFTKACGQPGSSQTGTATVQVNAAAISNATNIEIGDVIVPWQGSNVNFSVSLSTGSQDVPILVFKGNNPQDNYLAIKILRSQTVPGALNGGSPVIFGASDAVTTQTITYKNVPSGYVVSSPLVNYETAAGTLITLDYFGPAGQYLGVPSAAYQSGDYYVFGTAAQSTAGGAGGETAVGVETFTATGGPQTFTFPAAWAYSSVTAAALPTFSFAYSGFSGMPNVVDNASLGWFQGTNISNEIQMTATANYQNGNTSMTIPDLSSLSGFFSPKGFSGSLYWTAEVTQGATTGTNPPNGTIQYVANYGTYTLP